MNPQSSSRRAVLKLTAVSTMGLSAIATTSNPVAAHRAWCPRTPGFWKNPRNWPDFMEAKEIDPGYVIADIAIKKVKINKDDIIDILRTPPQGGDKSIIMAHHVIATKLNLIAGSEKDCIKYDDTFSDEWGTLPLANYWLKKANFWDNYSGNSTHRSWIVTNSNGDPIDGEPLKDRLDAYNNQRLDCGCSDGD